MVKQKITLTNGMRFRLSGSIYLVQKADKDGQAAQVVRESVAVEKPWPGMENNNPFRFEVAQLNKWSDFEILKA